MTNVHESWYFRVQQEPGLNVPSLCRHDICTYAHTHAHIYHTTYVFREVEIKNSEEIIFANTLFIHKYTQLQKQ